MWHRLKLSKNYAKAMEQVHTTLRYWPSFLRNKCKQRLTKMAQYLVRARNLAKKTEKVKLIPVSRKVERRLRSREAKALNAAKLENTIEKELLQRLQSGTYGDIYNFNQSAFTSALDQQTVEDEIEDELEEEEAELELEDDADFEAVYSSDDEDYSSGSDDDTLYEQEEEDEEDLEGEWVENGPDGSDDEDDLEEFPLNDSWGASDDEEAPAAPAPGSKKRSAGSQKSGGPAAKRRVHGAGGSFLEIEYEKEDETPAQLASN
ncbi:hypothetical protein, variant [Fonticula alba]|nr:hypothetical protein, variant [Fonticula alba]KCV73285.1 hypothetical protein, variant [Fonticula alba]|eukprot:XP_009492986.1 hypothetical protein, variant [Fonticula alba]